MLEIFKKPTALFIPFILCGLLWGCSAAPRNPLIVLDAGHNPGFQAGAVGLRGIDEVSYNDRFVAELRQAFLQAGWQVALTRTPTQSVSLAQRADTANRLQPDLFLSVHHDSAQLHYLFPITVNGKKAYKTVQPVRGSSILVSTENPKFRQSYRFARLLGEQLSFIRRSPARHHSGNMIGENHPLLDRRYGIYQYDKLVVLRTTRVPAVLFEVGVIVDAQDEAYVDNRENRRRLIQAVVNAANIYMKR